MQSIKVPEEILDFFHVDTRPVYPDFNYNDLKWVSDDKYIDSWGVKWQAAKNPKGQTMYYDMIEHPLEDANSLSEVENYDWPEPGPFTHMKGLEKRASLLKEETNYALVGHMGTTSIFELSWYLRSMEEFFADLLKRKEIADKILNKVFQIRKRQMKEYLLRVGSYLDVVAIGDDLSMQTGPLISPTTYRNMIKPYHEKYFNFIKNLTPAKLHMHSCGSVSALLPDLIEIGVDVINPVQVSAEGMSPDKLMDQFGGKIAFWGGIDTQQTLPNGSVNDVRKEVLKRIRQFEGKNGGYIVNSVHNIQADVPPENIVEMFKTAYEV